MKKGIDVAKWNGKIDWKKVKNAGVEFAILKVINKSCSIEDSFLYNYKGALKNNIEIGVYNYSYATSIAKAKADATIVSHILNDKQITGKVWLDVEDVCLKNLGSKLIDIINAYKQVIESNELKFGLYTGRSFYNSYIAPYGGVDCDLWIARYYLVNTQLKFGFVPDEKSKPVVSKDIYAWQFTSKGKVDGVNGNCDLNVIYDDCNKNESENANIYKTGEGLADYAISKLGTPYFFGSKMNVLTEKFMNQMHNQYPSTVTASYISKAKNKGQVGKINTDCSGLIGGYRGKQIGSSQLYSTAKRRLPISQINDFAIGTVLWKQGHVGVYIGNGECVEAKGINYGTIKSNVKDTNWQYGLTFDDMSYSYEKTIVGTSKQKNPYVEPVVTLRVGNSSECVKWLQFELNEAGYKVVIDGDFGPKTLNAVKQFQKSCKIDVDGLVGKITRQCLKNN